MVGEMTDRPFPLPSDFETMDQYWEALEKVNRRNNGLAPSAPRLPNDLNRVHAADELGGRQVGLRLPALDYERLQELSARYGVPPATMARMLVVRALRAHVPGE